MNSDAASTSHTVALNFLFLIRSSAVFQDCSSDFSMLFFDLKAEDVQSCSQHLSLYLYSIFVSIRVIYLSVSSPFFYLSFLSTCLHVSLPLALNPIMLHWGNACWQGQSDADDVNVHTVSGFLFFFFDVCENSEETWIEGFLIHQIMMD